MKEKKYRFEDAINATKAALEQGVVSGGGTILYRAAKSLETLAKKSKDMDETFGIEIVYQSLEVPMRIILDNAGFSTSIKNKIFTAVQKGKGYDGRTGIVVSDMYKAGIIDPVKIVKSAVESAASIAGLFLTSEVVIIDTPTEKNKSPYGDM
jgi:chaperonin GroEL